MTVSVSLVAAVLCVLGLAGCGGGNSPDTTTRDGRLAAVPKFPRSDAAGPVTASGGVRTRSYLAFGVNPADIIGWYLKNLDGWQEVGSVQQTGTDTVRATWQRGTSRLEISASPAPTTAHVGANASVQYNIVLRGGA